MMADGPNPMATEGAQAGADLAQSAPPSPGLPMQPPPMASPPGATAPATVPPINAGLQAQARVQVSMAMSILTKALAGVGAQSEEGQTIIEMLRAGGKRFGEASPDLGKQEAKLIGEQAAPIQTPTPQQGAAFQKAMQSRAAGLLGAPAG